MLTEITEIDKITNQKISDFDRFYVHPAKQFVITKDLFCQLSNQSRRTRRKTSELEPLEAHRLKQRTLYDIEMIEETGYCNGIENYSRHFDGRKPGERPFVFLIIS